MPRKINMKEYLKDGTIFHFILTKKDHFILLCTEYSFIFFWV
jgi:hypothetical protein